VFDGHKDTVNGALEMSDGNILSWSDDCTLNLWSNIGILLKTFEGHHYSVSDVRLIKNGYILSVTSGDNRVQIRDTEAGLKAFTSKSGDIRIWDNDGNLQKIMGANSGGFKGLKLLENGNILAWSCKNIIHLWNNNYSQIATMKGHNSTINGVLCIPNGFFISWSDDLTLRMWGATGEQLQIYKGHTEGIIGAVYIPNGHILTWSLDATIRLWRADGIQHKKVSMQDDRQYKTVLTCIDDDSIEDECNVICRGLLLTSDGKIITWGDCNSLFLWDMDLNLETVLQGHNDNVEGAMILNDGRILSWSSDKSIRIWNLVSNKVKILDWEAGIIAGVQEISDDKILMWDDSTYDITILKLDDFSRITLKGHSNSICGVKTLSDKKLISWSYDKTLRLWDTEIADVPSFLQGHNGIVNSAILMPNGTILSSGEDDTRLLLWSSEGCLIEKYSGYCLLNYNDKSNSVRLDSSKLGEVVVKSSNHTVDFESSNMHFQWQAESECIVRHFFVNGRIIATQANGQVCFLQTWLGNLRVTLDELVA